MDALTIGIILAVLGLCLGSFAGATVWRLRARQLVEDKRNGEAVDAKELRTLRPLAAASAVNDRSRCLHCGHQLAWYDLLPLVSWLSTGGKCRYCKARIGWFEPLMEIGTALFFVGSYLLWPEMLQVPENVAGFILWLIAGVMLVILFAYDMKWFLLPDSIVFPFIGTAALFAALQFFGAADAAGLAWSIIGSIAILSGLYLALYVVSKGQWIGFGDVKLGLGLALLVHDWQLAFLALFLANLIGCLIVIPGMIAGKIGRMTRVPFGPLLIVGTVISVLAGPMIIDWYLHILL